MKDLSVLALRKYYIEAQYDEATLGAPHESTCHKITLHCIVRLEEITCTLVYKSSHAHKNCRSVCLHLLRALYTGSNNSDYTHSIHSHEASGGFGQEQISSLTVHIFLQTRYLRIEILKWYRVSQKKWDQRISNYKLL